MRLSRSTPVVAALLAGAIAAGCGASSTRPSTATPAAAQVVQRLAPDTVDGWKTRSPKSLGLRARAMKAGAREARALDSTCFAVVRRGKLAGDWNWRLDRTVPREVFSITKSVTSALVGIAIRDGDLRLDDRVSTYVPQWRGTASETVTVRNLLSNDSGRFWSMSPTTSTCSGPGAARGTPSGSPSSTPPARRGPTTTRRSRSWSRCWSRRPGCGSRSSRATRLFEPLGMDHSTFVTDRADDAAVFYGLRTTCLDIARFGMLYLGEGAVDGTRLLDRSFVKRSVGRSSTTHNAAYGYLWWLNRPGSLRGATDPVDAQGQPLRPATGQLAPAVREDVFAALGFGGQVLLVDPRSQTMVIRLGLPAQPGAESYGFGKAAAVLSRALR